MREAVTMTARPTMISAKYRLKEERRRMLKLSVNKLRRIEDPESSLRRSVLINNTVRRLQREQREARNPAPVTAVDDATSTLFAETTVTLTPLRDEEPPVTTPTPPAPEPAAPNLVLEELEDVLSQFYMPPTPRMITSIDEDDDEDAARRGASPPRSTSSCPPPSKRPRLERLDRSDADDEGRALADPTNTLEDFKDEVYLRPTCTKPRVPLTACANMPCDDALRTDLCGRRYTHTGHDRENIAPFGLGQGLAQGLGLMGTDGQLAQLGQQGLGAAPGTATASAAMHSLQPYSCSQAHGQAQAGQHGLVFHSLMATMES